MAATLRKIFYFCSVKTSKRHEVAATERSVFCVPNFIRNIDRIECGTGNSHEVSALEYLTTRNAVFSFNVKNFKV